MQNYYIYILLCADATYYVGQTNDLEKRILEHNSKKFAGYTSSKLPVKLVFHYRLPNRSEALMLEKRIKKWSHAKKQALIEGLFSLTF